MTNEEKVDSMLKFFHGSRTLEDLLLEMAETTLEYEKVEFNGMLGKVTFEVNTALNTQPTVKSIKDEIERRYNDNLKVVEEYSKECKSATTLIFGSAAKEDFDILAFIENSEGKYKLNSFTKVV